jgi:serine/threonine-protein kinase RsbW
MKKKQYIFSNNISEISKLAVIIDNLLEEWELPQTMAFNLNLVLEELISNIIFYAFDDDKEHHIAVAFSLDNNNIGIEIKDDGKAFDPLQENEASEEVGKSIEERKIGGLGIHFVKKLMDDIEYKRVKNNNILMLKKYGIKQS